MLKEHGSVREKLILSVDNAIRILFLQIVCKSQRCWTKVLCMLGRSLTGFVAHVKPDQILEIQLLVGLLSMLPVTRVVVLYQ